MYYCVSAVGSGGRRVPRATVSGCTECPVLSSGNARLRILPFSAISDGKLQLSSSTTIGNKIILMAFASTVNRSSFRSRSLRPLRLLAALPCRRLRSEWLGAKSITLHANNRNGVARLFYGQLGSSRRVFIRSACAKRAAIKLNIQLLLHCLRSRLQPT